LARGRAWRGGALGARARLARGRAWRGGALRARAAPSAPRGSGRRLACRAAALPRSGPARRPSATWPSARRPSRFGLPRRGSVTRSAAEWSWRCRGAGLARGALRARARFARGRASREGALRAQAAPSAPREPAEGRPAAVGGLPRSGPPRHGSPRSGLQRWGLPRRVSVTRSAAEWLRALARFARRRRLRRRGIRPKAGPPP
jgi:hypothetical protein